MGLMRCHDKLKTDLEEVDAQLQVVIKDQSVIDGLETEKDEVKRKMKLAKKFILMIISSVISVRFRDIDPLIRTQCLEMADQTLKAFPEFQRKVLFKSIVENNLTPADRSYPNIILALTKLQ